MLFTYIFETLIDFFARILESNNFTINYESFMGALDVYSYGIHVLGAPLFNTLVGSIVAFYAFKLIWAVIEWLWYTVFAIT